MPNRRREIYTKGQINRVIDSLLHPFMRGEDKVPMMILDAVVHAIVEQDPKKSPKVRQVYGTGAG